MTGMDDGNATGGGNRGFQAHPWRSRVLEEIHADAVFKLHVEPRWVVALSIVPVALGVWYLVRRVRAAFSDRHVGG